MHRTDAYPARLMVASVEDWRVSYAPPRTSLFAKLATPRAVRIEMALLVVGALAFGWLVPSFGHSLQYLFR
jgi:hypothetical protein